MTDSSISNDKKSGRPRLFQKDSSVNRYSLHDKMHKGYAFLKCKLLF